MTAQNQNKDHSQINQIISSITTKAEIKYTHTTKIFINVNQKSIKRKVTATLLAHTTDYVKKQENINATVKLSDQSVLMNQKDKNSPLSAPTIAFKMYRTAVKESDSEPNPETKKLEKEC